MKKALPIILIAGAAIFLLMRRKGRTTVTADMPIKQSASEFEADFQASTVKPSLIDAGTNLISNLFGKKSAAQAKRLAVKRAVKSKTATKKQAKAITKKLSTIKFAGFDDSQLMF